MFLDFNLTFQLIRVNKCTNIHILAKAIGTINGFSLVTEVLIPDHRY